MAPRTLTGSERAAALSAMRGGVERQRAFAEEFDPSTFDAWQGWVWGRHSFKLSISVLDFPPPRVRVQLVELHATEYRAAKRDPDGKARRVIYRHEHDRPFASVCTTDAGAPGAPSRSSRGAPTFRGPALFKLGELYALEGLDSSGEIVRWRAPRGVVLVGCPSADEMHLLRTGEARKSCAPVWIFRGRSPYTLTDRGIEK